MWGMSASQMHLSACRIISRLHISDDSEESLPSCPGTSITVAVSGVPGDRSHVHTHDHDGSEAPDESPDSILSSGGMDRDGGSGGSEGDGNAAVTASMRA
ncbi:hypothetical protein Tco_0189079 [Tanacetum coccineum]